MANDPGLDYEIQQARQKTEAQLIHTLGNIPNPQNRQNIAARIALDEKRRESDRMRQEAIIGKLDSLKKVHWTHWVILAATLSAALFGFLQLLFQVHVSS